MNEKMNATPSVGKKTWSSPCLRTINLNSAQFQARAGNDTGGTHTKS
jgi:hypothetical protein